MKTSLFILLAFASVSWLQAQDSLRCKSLSFEQGVNYLVNKDLYRSPYVYKGLNPFVGLGFERSSAKYIHRVSAGLTFGSVKTSFSPLASVYLANIDYSYLRRIASDRRFRVYAGPQLSGFSWTANYFPEMQVPNYAKVRSYLLGVSMGLGTQFTYSISPRSSFKLLLYVPLAAYAERPHFLDGSTPKDGFSLLGLWNPQVQATYEYKVSGKISLYASYRYQYLLYAAPKELRMLGNGLSFGLKIHFGK